MLTETARLKRYIDLFIVYNKMRNGKFLAKQKKLHQIENQKRRIKFLVPCTRFSVVCRICWFIRERLASLMNDIMKLTIFRLIS